MLEKEQTDTDTDTGTGTNPYVKPTHNRDLHDLGRGHAK